MAEPSEEIRRIYERMEPLTNIIPNLRRRRNWQTLYILPLSSEAEIFPLYYGIAGSLLLDALYQDMEESITESFVESLIDVPTPVPPETVIKLPVEPYEPNEDNTCSICLNEYQERENLRRLPCQHRFHPDCIAEWFTRKNTCPLCKQKIE